MSWDHGLVSAIIINFNSGHYLERCVAALEAQTYKQREIIIVDNGSKDGSTALLRELALAGKIRLFEGENVGSSKANNLGIRESRGEFALVLNADAFLRPDYLERSVVAMREHLDVGTVVGKLVSDSDHSVIDSAGLYLYREGVVVDRGFGEKDLGQFDNPEFVDGACCAAALYRRSMLDQISVAGQFYNEAFFAFVEDAELSYRSTCSGWRTLYLPTAIAYHVRGGSSQSVSEFATYINERNIRVFLRVWINAQAKPLDRALQWMLLKLRDVKLRRLLSEEYRSRMNADVGALCDALRSMGFSGGSRGDLPRRRTARRRSFLYEAVMRRLRPRVLSEIAAQRPDSSG